MAKIANRKSIIRGLKTKDADSIRDAVRLLQRADEAYHDKYRPIMSDAEYDELRALLAKHDPKNRYLKTVGAAVAHGERVQLPAVMSSLDKVRPEEIEDWLTSIAEQPDLHGIRYVMALPKMDGISLMLHYRKGILWAAYTRGDGKLGRAVTVNARHIQGVVTRLKPSQYYSDLHEGDILVRGEAIIHRSIFRKHYADEKNARNWVGGQLTRNPNSKGQVEDEHRVRLGHCTFLAFGISMLDGKKEKVPDTKNAEFLALSSLGFTHVLNPQRYSEGHHRLNKALAEGKMGRGIARVLPVYPTIMQIETLLDVKDASPEKLRSILETNLSLIDVDQDGLVIVPLHSRWARNNIGGDEKRPDWIKAIKLSQSEQLTLEGKIKKVTWRNTRRRLLKPTVVLDKALVFNGVEVTNATGNNAACVLRNNLKAGTRVRLIRSGDVIPRLMEVRVGNKWVKFDEGKPAAGMRESLPKNCPTCRTKLRWTENKTDLVCPNVKCVGHRLDQVQSFFEVLDTESVKGGVVIQMVNDGLDTVPKIVKASVKRLVQIDGFKQAKATKVREGIVESLTEVDLPALTHASGCFVNENTSLGSTRIAEIISVIGQSQFLTGELTVIRQRLASVRGIGPIIMDLLIEGLPRFRAFLKSIEGHYTLKLPPARQSSNAQGLVAVWTGYRDEAQEKMLVSNGGKVGSGVSRNTSVVFYASTSSSKYKKAAAMGLTCVSKEQAARWLTQNVVKKRKKADA